MKTRIHISGEFYKEWQTEGLSTVPGTLSSLISSFYLTLSQVGVKKKLEPYFYMLNHIKIKYLSYYSTSCYAGYYFVFE